MRPEETEILRITALGHRGDGIAMTADRALHVPHTLPGDVVAVRPGPDGRPVLESIVSPSPDRADPFCAMFGTCGGCALQHMAAAPYLEWKRGLVTDALRQSGIEHPVDPCLDAHGRGRRRMTLHGRIGPDGRGIVGFTRARSHEVMALEACPIVTPALNRAFPAAVAITEVLRHRGKPLDLVATDTDGGLDLDVRGYGPPAEKDRLALTRLAERFDLARLSVHGDVVVERRAPFVRFGAAAVTPPPGGFLQATQAGEDRLAELVADAASKSRRVADLFAGCGTFALRLARRAQVHAVEGDKASIAALDRAARHTPGLKPLRAEARDLFRRPLTHLELNAFDAVVFDPPRAGAEAQARQLARSRVPLVIAVSCSPSTLARDLGILIAGGYRLRRITPVDQFRYSAHVEIVATLTR